MEALGSSIYGLNISDLISFVKYFFIAAVLIGAYVSIYILITPHAEIKLIRENNSSAAIAFSGSLMGFSLPIAIIIAHSSTLISCLVWGIIALVTQIFVFFIARVLIPGISGKIENGELASGIWLGTASLTGGIINAACMTY
jgi:putative membrane protein